MNELTYFPDGYTKEGYVRAAPGLHGALRFKFRPLRRKQLRMLNAEIGNRSAVESETLVCKMLAKQVLDWDHSHDGKVLPINVDAFENMNTMLLTRLENQVKWIEPPDLEENATPKQVDDFIASLDEDQEEADAKNSQTV